MLATVLAQTLAECARLVPQVGGPYAYVSRAFGRFPGFLAGWSMWLAELSALPVFAIAFTNYLGYFVHLNSVAIHSLRIGFLVVLTAVNVVSVRLAGRVNDVLTVLKLAPLFILVIGGFAYMAFHGSDVANHLTPFAPFGFHNFPAALVLVVWAYVGFELATVPAGEVKDPGRTIPRALALGLLIVTAFYLSTNVVLYSLVAPEILASSNTPLVLAGKVIFGAAGGILLAAGAMLSVSGSDESDMLGASRLGYAMAAEGMLPHGLAMVHPRFRTPYVALISQSVLAIALTFVNQISDLISFAVFNLAFSFLLCSLALQRLHAAAAPRSRWRRALPVSGAAISVGLITATNMQDKITGALVLAIGSIIYAVAAPGRPLPHVLAQLTASERVLQRLARRRMRFLGAPLGWLGGHRSP